MLLNKSNKALRSDSSRLLDKLDQVVGLENGRVCTGSVSHIYTLRGKVSGTFFDFSRKAKRKVRLIRDSVWVLK